MTASQFVEGFKVPSMFSPDAFRSGIQYKPRDDDVFIVTYPKCGTTWTQYIIALIFRQGQPFEDNWNFFRNCPFLDLGGAKVAETMPRPGSIKTHFPFHLAPWSEKAKYIYVTRNPKDTSVSYYHHMQMLGLGFKGTFDDFFELFFPGKVDYGDYFDHLLGWYEHRNKPNILFVTYEEMKEDPQAAILKMASFIDEEKYAQPLRDDPQKMECVLKYSSFKEMKVSINKKMEELFELTDEENAKSGVPDEMVKLVSKVKAMMKNSAADTSVKPITSNFVRKGIVGDWKNYFSEDQSKRMDEKFNQRTKGTEIANFWKGYM